MITNELNTLFDCICNVTKTDIAFYKKVKEVFKDGKTVFVDVENNNPVNFIEQSQKIKIYLLEKNGSLAKDGYINVNCELRIYAFNTENLDDLLSVILSNLGSVKINAKNVNYTINTSKDFTDSWLYKDELAVDFLINFATVRFNISKALDVNCCN